MAINDKVDDLLVGVLKQIRFNEANKNNAKKKKSINNNNSSDQSAAMRRKSTNEQDVPTNILSVNRFSKFRASLRSNVFGKKLFDNNNTKSDDFVEHVKLKPLGKDAEAASAGQAASRRSTKKKRDVAANDMDNYKSARSGSTGGNVLHKIFNSLFKSKRSQPLNLSAQSVDNLFTPSAQMIRNFLEID